MKYKCLVLDHDDTVVKSTATIHFPCFLEYLNLKNHPMKDSYTLNSYLVKNFHPGVVSLFRDELGMSEAEFEEEQKYWSEYVKSHIPTAYSGIAELLHKFVMAGGIIAVSSHSYEKYIIRDYKENGLPAPSAIYAWDLPPELRKPSPYTLFEVMKRFSLSPGEILMVDDLKPGYDMARTAGVPFAAAGWAYDVPEIESFMRENCDFYLKTVADLEGLIFE